MKSLYLLKVNDCVEAITTKEKYIDLFIQSRPYGKYVKIEEFTNQRDISNLMITYGNHKLKKYNKYLLSKREINYIQVLEREKEYHLEETIKNLISIKDEKKTKLKPKEIKNIKQTIDILNKYLSDMEDYSSIDNYLENVYSLLDQITNDERWGYYTERDRD